jgi:hypothetical protein
MKILFDIYALKTSNMFRSIRVYHLPTIFFSFVFIIDTLLTYQVKVQNLTAFTSYFNMINNGFKTNVICNGVWNCLTTACEDYAVKNGYNINSLCNSNPVILENWTNELFYISCASIPLMMFIFLKKNTEKKGATYYNNRLTGYNLATYLILKSIAILFWISCYKQINVSRKLKNDYPTENIIRYENMKSDYMLFAYIIEIQITVLIDIYFSKPSQNIEDEV